LRGTDPDPGEEPFLLDELDGEPAELVELRHALDSALTVHA